MAATDRIRSQTWELRSLPTSLPKALFRQLCTFTHLTLTAALTGRYYDHPHFREEDMCPEEENSLAKVGNRQQHRRIHAQAVRP